LLRPHVARGGSPARRPRAATLSAAAPADMDALIAEAARDFTEYQQLTAAGKLAEAGAKLESLKRALEELQARHH
jgi:hypothetical protein